MVRILFPSKYVDGEIVNQISKKYSRIMKSQEGNSYLFIVLLVSDYLKSTTLRAFYNLHLSHYWDIHASDQNYVLETSFMIWNSGLHMQHGMFHLI